MRTMTTSKFPLGQVVATPGALGRWGRAGSRRASSWSAMLPGTGAISAPRMPDECCRDIGPTSGDTPTCAASLQPRMPRPFGADTWR
jgi:hypothetical protein